MQWNSFVLKLYVYLAQSGLSLDTNKSPTVHRSPWINKEYTDKSRCCLFPWCTAGRAASAVPVSDGVTVLKQSETLLPFPILNMLCKVVELWFFPCYAKLLVLPRTSPQVRGVKRHKNHHFSVSGIGLSVLQTWMSQSHILKPLQLEIPYRNWFCDLLLLSSLLCRELTPGNVRGDDYKLGSATNGPHYDLQVTRSDLCC